MSDWSTPFPIDQDLAAKWSLVAPSQPRLRRRWLTNRAGVGSRLANLTLQDETPVPSRLGDMLPRVSWTPCRDHSPNSPLDELRTSDPVSNAARRTQAVSSTKNRAALSWRPLRLAAHPDRSGSDRTAIGIARP